MLRPLRASTPDNLGGPLPTVRAPCSFAPKTLWCLGEHSGFRLTEIHRAPVRPRWVSLAPNHRVLAPRAHLEVPLLRSALPRPLGLVAATTAAPRIMSGGPHADPLVGAARSALQQDRPPESSQYRTCWPNHTGQNREPSFWCFSWRSKGSRPAVAYPAPLNRQAVGGEGAAAGAVTRSHLGPPGRRVRRSH